MKYPYLILAIALFMLPDLVRAQGENNIWMFGRNYSLDFNYSPPLLKDDQYINGMLYANTSQTIMPNSLHKYQFAQAVCDGNGDVLFMVKMYVGPSSGPGVPNIFDRDEAPIAGTEFLQTNDMAQNRPIVVPHPGNSNQYYIFYVRNSGLLYCLFDMTLNNGKGDIVPGFKNVLHSGYNTIVGRTMTNVVGCDGVWIVARHKTNNQYLSFKVDAIGVQPPVASTIGTLTRESYMGDLVASPDGKTLATATVYSDLLNYEGGIELYDFDKCSGKLSNPRAFEISEDVYGLGFSPDNSKLYTAISEYNPALAPFGAEHRDHNLYQFDLLSTNLSDIIASKTLVFTNPTVQLAVAFCPMITPPLGSIRNGRDGKMYLTNSSPGVCIGGGVGLAVHVINQPNFLGLACSPNINAVYNSVNGMHSGTGITGRDSFPYEIIKAPSLILDTVNSEGIKLNVCFNDTILSITNEASCIEWSTGSSESTISIQTSGIYWVRYTKDCTVYIDSFQVDFSSFPKIDLVQYGCPGTINLNAGEQQGPSFKMELYNSFGGKIYGGPNQSLHNVHNLDEGIYQLKITSGNLCDTIIEVELKAYPTPNLIIDPQNATVKYGEEILLTGDGALYYSWTPQQYLSGFTNKEVTATPIKDTRFMLIGINDYGCKDTAYTMIKVEYNRNIPMPNAFTPNGDGKNDLFRIPDGVFIVRKFEVYNRFGERVHTEMGTNRGWDGKYKLQNCDMGVYHYTIHLDFPDGTSLPLKGDITLIR